MPGILKRSAAQPTTPEPRVDAESPAPAAASVRFLQLIQCAERQLQQARDAWCERWEHEAVRLACRIAARCLRESSFDSAALAAKLVDESLRGIRLDGGCEVRLHPDDYRELLPEGRWTGADVTVLPDSSVEPGGCVVRTADGTIDQNISAQIGRIEEELTRL